MGKIYGRHDVYYDDDGATAAALVGEEISRHRPTENYLEQIWSNFETEILKAEFVRMK